MFLVFSFICKYVLLLLPQQYKRRKLQLSKRYNKNKHNIDRKKKTETKGYKNNTENTKQEE